MSCSIKSIRPKQWSHGLTHNPLLAEANPVHNNFPSLSRVFETHGQCFCSVVSFEFDSNQSSQYNISEMISRQCWSKQSGGMFAIWTAGQRFYPSTKSIFVWKPEPNPSSWSEMRYTAWGVGQPNYAGSQEYCAHLAWLSQGNILWNDAPCGFHTAAGIVPDFGFQCVLCEIDMK